MTRHDIMQNNAGTDQRDEELALLRSTLDATNNAKLCVDEYGRVTLMNRQFLELWSADEDIREPDALPRLRERLLGKIVDPERMRVELDRLRGDHDAVGAGQVELLDGRVVEWHSGSLRRGQHHMGRLYSFIDVTPRVNAERAMEQRLRLESSIARIAAALTSPGELDLDGVLAELGRAVNVHRTYIMRFHADGVTCDNTHEWCADGVQPEIQNLQAIDTSPLTWWWSSMGKGEPVVINDIRAMPPEGALEQEFLGAQGIQSLLALPIVSREHGLIGFVGYDDVQRPRDWSADDLRALRVVSDLLAAELDRRVAADALRASEERLTQVLDATTHGFYDWNIVTDTVEFSARWFEMLHESPELNGTPTAIWWHRVHPDDRAALRQAVTAHLSGATVGFQSEQRMLDGRGAWRWILTRGRVVAFLPDGRPARAVGTHTDITARRHLEDQLRQSQKMEAVGQLAGGIAHDFNNLLTAIIGHASFLNARLNAADPAFSHAVEIHRAAERAAELTRQLLAFSRKQLLVPQVMDLRLVVSDMERMLARLIGTHIQLETEAERAPTFVRADPGQLQQVLLNLVVNARDAMPVGGKLRVQVYPQRTEVPQHSAVGHVPAGDWVVLAVTDTGDGIDPVNMARIFEPFFTTKEQGKGTGLGLAMVDGIVAQSEGHVWLDSEVGVGTSVRIYLPRVEATGEYAPPATPANLPDAYPEASGERILLVEDDATVRLIVTEVLKASGYNTIVADTPEQALRLTEDMVPVDLILTDIVMPGMNGTALVTRLLDRWPDTRVLFMSGYSDLELAESGIIEAGFDFIGKPFTPRALVTRVRDVLGARAGTRA